MGYQFIDIEERGKVLVIRMNDPATRNSMGGQLQEEFLTEIARAEKSPDVRCLVITGADPSFCSGGNIRKMLDRRDPVQERAGGPPLPWVAMDARLGRRATEPREPEHHSVQLVFRRLQKPTIAAVNGYALGMGNALALSCDIRIASEKASFAETFIQRGITSGAASWILPRMIGLSNAYMMLYTGDRVDANTALRWGLVSKVVPHEKLMDTTMELATRLAEGPTYALGMTKFMVQHALISTYEETLETGRAANDVCRMTHDHEEGVRAFNERRAPHFEGR